MWMQSIMGVSAQQLLTYGTEDVEDVEFAIRCCLNYEQYIYLDWSQLDFQV